MCYNPIGRDDTGGSGVWVLYREWLYPNKNAKNLFENHSKNIEFELHGSFRGALELGNSANGVRNTANLMVITVFSQTLIFGLF